MTPREKAEKLVDRFMKYRPIKISDYTNIEYPSAVNLAKICVEEVLSAMAKRVNSSDMEYIYWLMVEQELNEM